ncbi:hypothetical protein MTO96_044994, partial [Rhipicephalus appendiculatus]
MTAVAIFLSSSLPASLSHPQSTPDICDSLVSTLPSFNCRYTPTHSFEGFLSAGNRGAMTMSPGGSRLSLVAQFDDFCRRNTVFADTAAEELILEFVRNQEACRKQWHATVLENAELKKQIASLTETNTELERKLAHTKEVLRKELLRRERCEEEAQQKKRQLEQVRNLLTNNTEICDETAEKLSVIMPTPNGPQDHPGRMSIVDESVGSVLSPSRDDLDISEDSPPCFDPPGSQGKRRYNFFDGLSPLGKKSKINSEGDQHRANVVHTTVTITDGQNLVATTRVVAQPPTPSAPDVPDPATTTTDIVIFDTNDDAKPEQRRPSGCSPDSTRSAPKAVIKTETCGPCGKRIKFYKTVYKCSRCNAVCHLECRHQVPLPCIPAANTPKHGGGANRQGALISDYAPPTAPMVPALVVHCIQEVERRGLDCVGIYRVPGSEREVREIRERFQQGKGVPNLSKADIYAVCGVLKDFLRSLRESLITKSLWHTFVSATALEHEDRVWAMWQAVMQLPPPPTGTPWLPWCCTSRQWPLAPEAKMPLSNLARIFAPTVVGCSVNNTASVPNLGLELEQQNQ